MIDFVLCSRRDLGTRAELSLLALSMSAGVVIAHGILEGRRGPFLTFHQMDIFDCDQPLRPVYMFALDMLEQLDREGICLGRVSCIVDVKMVSTVVSGEQLSGVARISHNFVKINRSVKLTTVADPVV